MAYTWDADAYSKNSTFQKDLAAELVANLNLTGNERIMDLGSGDGKIAADIAALVSAGKVMGVDASPVMVKFAQESFPSADHPNLSFILMDARKLSFEEEFDLVFSTATLHWIEDHRSVLAGIRRSLAPGGRIVLQMGGKGNTQDMIETTQDLIKRPEWQGFFNGFTFPWHFYDVPEYESWLKEAGLISDEVKLMPKDAVYPTREMLTGWFGTTWLPYLDRIPEERRPEFVEAAVKAYLEVYPPDKQGRIHNRMARLQVKAHRP
jgi:trans-aconitate 2-methyltransferase